MRSTQGYVRRVIRSDDGSLIHEKVYAWPSPSFNGCGSMRGPAPLTPEATCNGLLVAAARSEIVRDVLDEIDPGLGVSCRRDYEGGVGCYAEAGSALRLLVLHATRYGLQGAVLRIAEIRTRSAARLFATAWKDRPADLAAAVAGLSDLREKDDIKAHTKVLRSMGLPYAPRKDRDEDPYELRELKRQIRITTGGLSGGGG